MRAADMITSGPFRPRRCFASAGLMAIPVMGDRLAGRGRGEVAERLPVGRWTACPDRHPRSNPYGREGTSDG
jgi:hypothetical protein